MATARERIKEILKREKRPLDSAELQKFLPEYTRGNIYTTTSVMVMKYKELYKDSSSRYDLIENKQKEPSHIEQVVSDINEQLKDKQFTLANTPIKEVPRGKFTAVPNGVSGRKSKVFWTEDERVKMAWEIHNIRTQAPHSVRSAFEIAQVKVIAGNRKREVTDWDGNIAPWLYPLLDLIKQAQAAGATAPQPNASQPPIPTPAPGQNFSSLNLDTLLQSGIQLLKKVIQDAITDSYQSLKSEPGPDISQQQPVVVLPKHNPEPQQAERPRPPKVIILGIPKAHQQQEIEKEFSGKLAIRFGHTDDPTPMVLSRAAGCDYAVVLKDHCNHRVADAIRGYSVPHGIISGHIEALKTNLRNFLESRNEDSAKPNSAT